MASYKLSIVTPKGLVYENEVDSVAAAGVEGGFGVLSGHASMLAEIIPGVLSLKSDGKEQLLVVSDGILEVSEEGVVVLADRAEPADSLEAAQATLAELVAH
ncbi:MAG: F-type H+-transporting ATPase subunit epsilon [Rhodothermales bacterium]|jgi:F-type H+-transporting ATPase subunit epsilon